MPSLPDYNGIFRAIAKASASVSSMNDARGIQAPAWVTSVASSYGIPPSVTEGSGSALQGFQNAAGALAGLWASQAAGGLTEAMEAAVRLPDKSLASAFEMLRLTMMRDNQRLKHSTTDMNWIPATPIHGTIAMASYTNDVEISYTETMNATMSGSNVNLEGERAAPARMDPEWPKGSGVSRSLPLVNAEVGATRAGTAQMLQSATFDTWAGGLPVSWKCLASAEAIAQGSPDYEGADCLQFVGDGYSKPSLSQEFGSMTPAIPGAGSLLAWNVFLRTSARPTSGEFEVCLLDGDGKFTSSGEGACFKRMDLSRGVSKWGYGKWGRGGWGAQDGQGAWGRFTWGRSAWAANIGGPFVSFSGVFRLPDLIPPGLQFCIRLSQPLNTGVSLQIDCLAAAVPSRLYRQGPAVAFFAGDPKPDNGYTGRLIVSNNKAGYHHWAIEQLFGTSAADIASLPSSPNPTIGSPSPVFFPALAPVSGVGGVFGGDFSSVTQDGPSGGGPSGGGGGGSGAPPTPELPPGGGP